VFMKRFGEYRRGRGQLKSEKRLSLRASEDDYPFIE